MCFSYILQVYIKKTGPFLLLDHSKTNKKNCISKTVFNFLFEKRFQNFIFHHLSSIVGVLQGHPACVLLHVYSKFFHFVPCKPHHSLFKILLTFVIVFFWFGNLVKCIAKLFLLTSIVFCLSKWLQ